VILAANGYLWVQSPPAADGGSAAVTRELREKIARVANAVVALRTVFVAVHAGSIAEVYDESVRLKVPLAEMRDPNYVEAITRRVSAREASAAAAVDLSAADA